jgi:hypothetical protein
VCDELLELVNDSFDLINSTVFQCMESYLTTKIIHLFFVSQIVGRANTATMKAPALLLVRSCYGGQTHEWSQNLVILQSVSFITVHKVAKSDDRRRLASHYNIAVSYLQTA